MMIEDMEEILDRLGISTISARGDEILALCPGHKMMTGREDHNPSWWINADTGAHICFSCGYKGGLLALISNTLGLVDVNGLDDYGAAKDWLASLNLDTSKYAERLAKAERVFERPAEQLAMTDSRLALFVTPPEYARQARGFTERACVTHELLWEDSRQLWVTPIRHPFTGSLLGWQEKGFRDRFFNNYPAGVEKSTSLYGYAQYTGGDMIVVESPLDVVRLTSVGISGGVATYGAMISNLQMSLIRGADRVIFALDNDDAGRTASEKIIEQTRTHGFEAWFFNYSRTDMKDVGAMSRTEIEQGLATARHSLNGKRALVWAS